MDSDDFQKVFQSLNNGSGTRKSKRLPAIASATTIPLRSGSALPVEQTGSSGGSDMELDGAKVVTSTDGLITMSYPESAEVVIGETTLVLPAISKSP